MTTTRPFIAALAIRTLLNLLLHALKGHLKAVEGS
jgi:hypothetical protein